MPPLAGYRQKSAVFGDHVVGDYVAVEAKLASSLDTVIRYRSKDLYRAIAELERQRGNRRVEEEGGAFADLSRRSTSGFLATFRGSFEYASGSSGSRAEMLHGVPNETD